MEQFINEIRQTPTADLLLILEDQQELYTPEELAIIREELSRRPVNAVELEEDAAEREWQQEEAARQQREEYEQMQRQETHRQTRLSNLKSQGYEGYYEYRVVQIYDTQTGNVDPAAIVHQLNDLALDGWRLRCAFANEVGQNSSSAGIYGFTTGTNATIDQNILILERFVKFN